MSCPFCKSKVYQQYMGNLGGTPYYRCGSCGMQYGGAEPSEQYSFNRKSNAVSAARPHRYEDMVNVTGKGVVVSRSEWGSFRYDGDADMKVLRKRAEGAVRYFNNGNPRADMETHIFGYPFSIIDNGRLLDNDKAYKGNVIIRALSYKQKGVYAGNVTLSYNDSYNDGRGQGGSGAVILNKVIDVRIDGDYLVITGINGPSQISYRYLIQEHEDTKPFVHPIPKKKGQSYSEDDEEEEPEPKKAAPKKETKPAVKKETKKETPKKSKDKIEFFEDKDVSGLWTFDRPDGLYGRISYDIHQKQSERYIVEIRHSNGIISSKAFLPTLDDAKDFAKSYKLESRFGKQSTEAVYEQEDYGVWTYKRKDGIKGQIIESSVPGHKNSFKISGLPIGPVTCGSLDEAKQIIEGKILEAKTPKVEEKPKRDESRFKIPVGTAIKKAGGDQWSYDKPDGTFHADIQYSQYKDYFRLIWNYPEDGHRGHEATVQSLSEAYERIKKEIDARDAKYTAKKTEKKGLSKPVPTVSKPKKETKKTAKPIPTKGGMEFQVRVEGTTLGTFTSKAKAQALVKELKGQGKKPKIYTVFT